MYKYYASYSGYPGVIITPTGSIPGRSLLKTIVRNFNGNVISNDIILGNRNLNIKGAIFDLDGVLVDTIPLHYAAWKRMFEEYGYEFNQQIYREKVDGLPRLDGVMRVMSGLDMKSAVEAGNRKQDYFLELIHQQGIQPFQTTIPFISLLKKHGIALAVASSSVNATAILEKIGVLKNFKTVVTAEDVSAGKPHPEIFLTAAKRLGLSASDCLVFEDAESGVAAAKRGGFFCIGVNRNRQPGFTDQADMVITDLDNNYYQEIEHQFRMKSY